MAMDAKKKRKLQQMGGRVATVAEFLGLSEAEAAVVELRLELAGACVRSELRVTRHRDREDRRIVIARIGAS
jgi:hypothetical protein